METDGGGWTVVFLADRPDYNSTDIGYTVPAAGLLAPGRTTQMLIAYRPEGGGAPLGPWAVLPIPEDWRAATLKRFLAHATQLVFAVETSTRTASMALRHGLPRLISASCSGICASTRAGPGRSTTAPKGACAPGWRSR